MALELSKRSAVPNGRYNMEPQEIFLNFMIKIQEERRWLLINV